MEQNFQRLNAYESLREDEMYDTVGGAVKVLSLMKFLTLAGGGFLIGGALVIAGVRFWQWVIR